MTFQAPKNIPGLDDEPNRALVRALGDIQNDLGALGDGQPVTAVQTADYVAQSGEFVRVRPPAAGMKVLLPPGTTANQSEHVQVTVQSAASGGSVTVAVAGATQKIDGATTKVLTAVGLVEFKSLGTDGWTATSLGFPAAFVPTGTGFVHITASAEDAAAKLVDTADINNSQVTNGKLANMPGNSVKAEATGVAAAPQDLAVGANTVVGRAGGNVVAAQLVGAQVAAATLPLTTIATQAANTLLANATAGVASPTAVAVGTESVFGQTSGNLTGIASAVQTALIRAAGSVFWAAAAANQVLRRSGAGDLGMGLLVDGNLTANTITHASEAQPAANTSAGNWTAGVANMADNAVGANTVIGRAAGNIVAAAAVNAQLAAMPANSFKAEATGAAVSPQDVAISAQSVLGRAAANIVNLTAGASQVLTRGAASNLGFQALELATIAAQAAKSVVANATNGSAAPTALASSAVRQYLRVNDANTALEWGRAIDAVKTAATIVSALTTVLATTGTYSIPANTLAVGSKLQCVFTVTFVRGATATALNLACFLNLGATGASITLPAQTAAGTYYLRVEGDVTVLTTGAGGTAMIQITAYGTAWTGATTTSTTSFLPAAAINTTIANNLFGQAQMSAAVAATTLQASGGHTEWLS